MPFTFTMPKLSPTMEEGSIAKWYKNEGEFVQSGEVLLEIATDKATVEHEALDEGYLRKILISDGQTAIINQPIAIFTEEKDESIEGFQPESVHSEAPTEAVENEEPIPQMAQKPSSPALAPSQPAFTPEAPLPMEPAAPHSSSEGRIKASPLAKRLAKKKGLDLSTVKGSGPGGRISSRDLEHAQPLGLVTFGREEAPTLAPGTFEEIPLSPMRKIIARRLQESKSFIPHFYITQYIDADPLCAFREQLKACDLKITFNDMIIRAAALALRAYPEVNSGFNSVNQTIIQFKTIDIAVAVTIEAGLITPIIRHTDFKNLGQISTEVRALAEKAKKGKLQEQEYKGGSFCISNLGMYGVTEFTAVINSPQSAILAVGGIEERAVVKNGQVTAGKTLALTLSADHRVVDGALGAKFIKQLQHLLENPVALTL